jgi:hypothetical protein
MSALAKTDEARGAVVQMNDGSALQRILDAARDPAVDVDKYERLMAMYERTEARMAAQAYAEAMNAAQAEMAPISRDAANPQTKSKYATYGALDAVVRPIYTKHGFSLSFGAGEGAPPDHVRVVCRVRHSAGGSETFDLDMPADGKGAKGSDVMTKTHATMSAFSYGKRGHLKNIFNLAEVDDDGNGASNHRGPVKTITEEQAASLIEIMESIDFKREKFLRYFKLDTVEALPASLFETAVEQLNGIVAKRKGAA